MSIAGQLRAALNNQLLVDVRPPFPSTNPIRMLWVHHYLHETIMAGLCDPAHAQHATCIKLYGAMQNFVAGRRADEQFIKQMDPKNIEFWELKARTPAPAWRIFGAFVAKDAFVATHAKPRVELGGYRSDAYYQARLEHERIWNETGLPFPMSHPPDFPYSEYVSNGRPQVEID